MAHALSITDGTTTFSLSTTNCLLTLYVPTEPQAGETAVTETVELSFIGASLSAMRTAIESLQRLLETARRKQEWGIGPTAYFQFQPDSEANVWRSELRAARIEYNNDTLKAWGQAILPASLIIERAPVWERATLVQIPATNGNGTNNTSGLTVYSHDDGGAGNDNHIQFAAADVLGSLPTPLVLELTNNTGGTVQYEQILMACNAFSDPANFGHVMQAEVALASGGTVTSDATCSNNGFVGRTFTSTDSQQYNLTSTLLQDAQGHDFHLLARFKARTVDVYVRPSVYDSTGTYPFWTGSEVHLPLVSSALSDLGVIPLPPGGYSANFGAMRLRLDWRTATSATVETDFFAFFPAATFRKLKVLSAVGNGSKVVDDPTAERAYIATSGGIETPGVAPQGMPLMVWPNTLQRVYFAWSLANLSAPVTQTLSVKVWHRPRRYSF